MEVRGRGDLACVGHAVVQVDTGTDAGPPTGIMTPPLLYSDVLGQTEVQVNTGTTAGPPTGITSPPPLLYLDVPGLVVYQLRGLHVQHEQVIHKRHQHKEGGTEAEFSPLPQIAIARPVRDIRQ